MMLDTYLLICAVIVLLPRPFLVLGSSLYAQARYYQQYPDKQANYDNGVKFPKYDNNKNPMWYWGLRGSNDDESFLEEMNAAPQPEHGRETEWPCVGEFEAYDPFRGKCYELTTKGGCAEGEWWILNKYGRARCSKRPCPQFYALNPHNNKCILMNTADEEGGCPKGHRYVHDLHGIARCECRPRHYRIDFVSNQCFPTYQQGPCMDGYYLILNKKKNVPVCVFNICDEGLLPVDNECKKLGDTCGEYGMKNVYINPHDGKIGCYDFFRLPM